MEMERKNTNLMRKCTKIFIAVYFYHFDQYYAFFWKKE
jgi:hypothetical protein